MIKSMTGFGKATAEVNGKKINVELRSVNSKQLDLNLRISNIFRDKETEIRQEVGKSLERGKIDLSIYVESAKETTTSIVNKELAMSYHKELKALSKKMGEKRSDFLSLVLKMPDVMKSEKQELDEKEWKQTKVALNKALNEMQKFRKDEGSTLGKELENSINSIDGLLKKVASIDASRITDIRTRIKKNLEEVVEKEKIDRNRFEQELIYYIEKLDINEEKVRLKTHLDYFLKTMKEDSSGRKLGFISQEIGREINTIGSKANNAEVQKLVVQMKDELEKIKEQLSNIL